MRRAEVRWRLLIAVSAAPAILAAFLWLLRYLLDGPWYHYQWPLSYLLAPTPYATVIFSLLFGSVLLFLYLYLQTGLSRERYLNEALTIANERRAQTAPEPAAASSAPQATQTEASSAEAARLRSMLVAEAAAQTLAELQLRMPHYWQTVEQIDRRTTVTLARINAAIRNLGWRGNVNLLVGVAVTAVGIATLGYFVTQQHSGAAGDYLSVLAYYLPRLTIVIIVEVFAYFFLKLYRSALDDEKYYNNEMTNAEVQSRALVVAVLRDDGEAVRSIVQALSHVDRNPTQIGDSSGGTNATLAAMLGIVKELRGAAKGD